MSSPRIATALLILAASAPGPRAEAQALKKAPAPAPQPRAAGAQYPNLDALNAAYAKQMVDLDRRRIADMATLAKRQAGPEAEATYRELFGVAIARDLYADAEKAAHDCLQLPPADRPTKALAALITLVAEANRGNYDKSLAGLKAFLKKNPPAEEAERRLDAQTVLSLGEAYLQRLIRGGRFDIAKQVCELANDHPDPAIREHFQKRLARLEMVGKPAPPVEGLDVDGKKISLA